MASTSKIKGILKTNVDEAQWKVESVKEIESSPKMKGLQKLKSKTSAESLKNLNMSKQKELNKKLEALKMETKDIKKGKVFSGDKWLLIVFKDLNQMATNDGDLIDVLKTEIDELPITNGKMNDAKISDQQNKKKVIKKVRFADLPSDNKKKVKQIGKKNKNKMSKTDNSKESISLRMKMVALKKSQASKKSNEDNYQARKPSKKGKIHSTDWEDVPKKKRGKADRVMAHGSNSNYSDQNTDKSD